MAVLQLNKLLLAILLLAAARPAPAFLLVPIAFATGFAGRVRSCTSSKVSGVDWARRPAGVAVLMSLTVDSGAVEDEAGDLKAMAAMALRIQILEDALQTSVRHLDAANTRVAELEVLTPRIKTRGWSTISSPLDPSWSCRVGCGDRLPGANRPEPRAWIVSCRGAF